jgi:hypothetical protein
MKDARRWRVGLMAVVFFSVFSTEAFAALSANLVDQLLASDGSSVEEDQFGFSVDVDGDRAVIGARQDDIYKGSAYVFYNNPIDNPDLGWVEEQKLLMPGGVTQDWFGHSVGIEGDVIVVGAPFRLGLEDSGTAWVFTRDSGTGDWASGVQLDPETTYDDFGWSVAIDNGTIVIGELLDRTQGSRAGSVHIFELLLGDWTRVAKLLPPFGIVNQNFGFSVAIDVDTIVVGAPHWTTGSAIGMGAAYAFNRGSGWVDAIAGANEELPATDNSTGDFYGASVGISGDLAVVGASFDDDPIKGDGSGSITILDRSGGSWAVDEKLTASDGGLNDAFGYTVAVSGLTVGAGAAKQNMGSFYLFAPTDTGWSEDVNMMASSTDRLGSSIALDGSTLLVGANHLGETGEGLVFDVTGIVVPLPLDLDIKSFTASPKGVRLSRPKEVVLTLKIKNNSQSTGSVVATVTGFGAGVVFSDTFPISDPPGGSATSFIIPTGISPPTDPGIIIWDVTFEDDDADVDMGTAQTKVK